MPQTNIISPDAPQITTKHTPAAPHQRKARARVHTPHRPISYHHDAQARGIRKATLRVPTRLIVPYHITTPRRTRPRHYINAKQARASTCLIDPHHITTTHRHAAHAKRDCVCRHASSTHIGSPQHDAQVQGTTSTQNRRARPHASSTPIISPRRTGPQHYINAKRNGVRPCASLSHITSPQCTRIHQHSPRQRPN